jgi:hypothetical protein
MLEYYTNIDKDVSRKNILKDQFTLEKSDYEKLKQAQQYNQLYSLQYKKNEEIKKIKENKNIYNLSINSLLKNLSIVSMNLLEDLTIFINSKDKSINKFFFIFTKEDRLLYVGILLIILSMSLWFIDISN